MRRTLTVAPGSANSAQRREQLQQPVGKGCELTSDHRQAHEDQNYPGGQMNGPAPLPKSFQVGQEMVGEQRGQQERQAQAQRVDGQQGDAVGADGAPGGAQGQDAAQDRADAGGQPKAKATPST
ncbi:hypothetical protein FQZ97_1242140 [compost metagenome]